MSNICHRKWSCIWLMKRRRWSFNCLWPPKIKLEGKQIRNRLAMQCEAVDTRVKRWQGVKSCLTKCAAASLALFKTQIFSNPQTDFFRDQRRDRRYQKPKWKFAQMMNDVQILFQQIYQGISNGKTNLAVRTRARGARKKTWLMATAGVYIIPKNWVFINHYLEDWVFYK